MNRILKLARVGNLRSLYIPMPLSDAYTPRTGLVKALAGYGPAWQLVLRSHMRPFARFVKAEINGIAPDLIIFQLHDEGVLGLEDIGEIRRAHPDALTVNWNGDIRAVSAWSLDVARAVHIQMVVSPDLFGPYQERGAIVGHWPNGAETEYLAAERKVSGPDVVFMGHLYDGFEGTIMRHESVFALSESGLKFDLYGNNWRGLNSLGNTTEQHEANAGRYAAAKMGLSVSNALTLRGCTSDRLFNITATGCPALVAAFPGLVDMGFIDGQSCIAFKTIPELLDKARYYAAHDAEREAIGAAGREVTHRRHTWAARLEALWAMMKGL